MAVNRLSWLLSALCSLVFLSVYQRWLAWLVMGAVLLVPVFSLLISLPAMLSARLHLTLPEQAGQGIPLKLPFVCRGLLPPPQWRCRVEVTHVLSGRKYRLRPGDRLWNDHCGQLQLRLKRVRICDYLGIFTLPLRGQREYRMMVLPTPVPLPEEQVLRMEKICTWKPKAGGFAENHELRLYRPGDSVRQIHWKLTAKTGKLILREPMVPNPGRVLVRLELRGTPDQLDRMLGRLSWLGDRLLEEGIPFELQCLTGSGIQSRKIENHGQLERQMDLLLGSRPAMEGSLFDRPEAALRVYDIGGEPDEP